MHFSFENGTLNDHLDHRFLKDMAIESASAPQRPVASGKASGPKRTVDEGDENPVLASSERVYKVDSTASFPLVEGC